jgi:hypothetical protein
MAALLEILGYAVDSENEARDDDIRRKADH